MSRTHAISHDALRLNRPILISARLSSWIAVRRQRAQLARLDASALEDLGLSRFEADSEASRPFWDVPATWRK